MATERGAAANRTYRRDGPAAGGQKFCSSYTTTAPIMDDRPGLRYEGRFGPLISSERHGTDGRAALYDIEIHQAS